MKHFESLYPTNSREKEIGQILTCIKSGNFSQAISLPGGGRSNLLALLAYNKALREKHLGKEGEIFHFVLCNFSEIRNKPLTDALKFLFLWLIDSLKARKLTEEATTIEPMFKKAEASSDSLVVFHAIKTAIEYLTLEKNMKIVFLFDRFEEYLPMLANEFFANLRILRKEALYKFSVVFALPRPLEQLLDPQIIEDIYEFIADHSTYLNICDLPTLAFRISYIEKALNKKVDKNLFDKIIELTAGHVNLTRLCVETILESRVDAAPPEFLLRHKSIQNALLDIWKSFTPAEQRLLATSKEQLATSSGNDYAYLKNIGILANGKITVRLLDIFIKQNLSIQSTEQHIVFDEATREIKKGNLLISDKLSSFEYRLLKFFLQNSNRTVERDEIINAVWGEEGSTAGVSDEALDQLVFRLRKKVENDPNNPSHLQTVKGRGFRFTP